MGIDLWVPAGPAEGGQPAPAAVTDPRAETVPARPLPAVTDPAQPLSREAVDALGWDALRVEVEACTRCELHTSRTQTVFGVGCRDAGLMVIGEAPGADEDRAGEPFVGRAGRLLNNMLLAVGLKREAVYIANILKCRPPGNRDPSPQEALACESFLMRQIALVKPKVILGVGRICAQNLLKTDTRVGRLRGRVHTLAQGEIPVVITYHPAYLLRAPSAKRRAWEDLQIALEILADG